ncbi:MAG: DUF2480 family protein [Bacteroidetes bacterium]|nr:DUF2480 family protein [Bacteroidota bacterium]
MEIVNRVEKSGLVTLDLGDFYPKATKHILDIKPWLFQGLLLKEKDFRQYLKEHYWQQYQDGMVNVICSSDAIIPNWAYMLIAVELEGIAWAVSSGSENELITAGYLKNFYAHDFSIYKDKPVIMKGCGFGPTPPAVFIEATARLKPFAKSVMFGEPCSTVPVYKRKKQ